MRNSPRVVLRGLSLCLALLPVLAINQPSSAGPPTRTKTAKATVAPSATPMAAEPVSSVRPRKTPLTAMDSYQALGLTPRVILAPPPNDNCSGAITIPCGNIDLEGNTIEALDDYSQEDDTLGCTTFSSHGNDVVYKFNAVAGDSVWLRYWTTADGSFYIVTDCGNVVDSCKAGADLLEAGGTESINYRFPRTATYYLILDSYGDQTFGPWTLVGQFISCGLFPPANDRCTTADPLLCGVISKSGSTLTAFNDYSFPSGGACINGSQAGGRDVAYRMELQAGDSINVNMSSSADAVLYIIGDCGDVVNSCMVGSNQGGPGVTENIKFRFLYTGTYYLIVDFNGANAFGSWGLTGNVVCGVGPPTNDNCSGATPIRCGFFSFSGSTVTATNDYNMFSGNSCTGYETFGPDVAFRIDAAPGDSLWADYRSTQDGSIYLVTYCPTPGDGINLADSCVVGVDDGIANDTEALRWKFTLRRTYWLILDSFDANQGGTWTLNGNMICPLIADAGQPVATGFELGEFQPNPFGNSTAVRFTLPTRDHATLRIHDLAGRVVRTLVDGELAAGMHTSKWDARDQNGARVPAGMYFARLTSGEKTALRKMLFVR